jgi:hypothetical protein
MPCFASLFPPPILSPFSPSFSPFLLHSTRLLHCNWWNIHATNPLGNQNLEIIFLHNSSKASDTQKLVFWEDGLLWYLQDYNSHVEILEVPVVGNFNKMACYHIFIYLFIYILKILLLFLLQICLEPSRNLGPKGGKFWQTMLISSFTFMFMCVGAMMVVCVYGDACLSQHFQFHHFTHFFISWYVMSLLCFLLTHYSMSCYYHSCSFSDYL